MFPRNTLNRVSMCLVALFSASISPGAEQTFPYQAAVVSDKVEVRCGPGAQFYVTSRLGTKDGVTVRRHDHGGWYMIDPPPGSVSWIDAVCVKRLGPDRGIVTLQQQDGVVSRAIVRIGSVFSDEHSYSGRELFPGDEVTVLGEETLTGPRGPVRMLKIAPPAQEFRWVKGEFLVPVSRQVQQQVATDPYQVPAEHRQRLVAEGKAPLLSPAVAEEPLPAANPEEAAERQQLKEQYAQLDAIDQQYAALVARPPVEWHLDPILSRYQQLRQVSLPKIAALIDQRLEVVARRKEIAGHYQKFLQVAAEASQVDAQLVGSQPDPHQVVNATGAMMGDSRLADAGDAPVYQGGASQPPQPLGATPPPVLTAPMEDPAELVAKLTGAGVVQPVTAAPGFPPFALMSPDGRILSYLVPGKDVRMDQWLGKPVGVTGPRAFDPKYSGDVIQVERVSPVQLMR